MQRNTMILFLIFSTVMIQLGWGDEKLPIEIGISIFPKEVAPGDTCYVLVEVTNNSDLLVLARVPQFYRAIQGELVQFCLSREGKTWHGTFEYDVSLNTGYGHIPPSDYQVASGEAIVYLALPLQFPPLDELHTPFWEETLRKLQDHPEGLVFDFWVHFPGPFWDYPLLFDKDYTEKLKEIYTRIKNKVGFPPCQVTIKLRNADEMAMIEKWYQNTPQSDFPIIEDYGRDPDSSYAQKLCTG